MNGPASPSPPPDDGLDAWLRGRGVGCSPPRAVPDGARVGRFTVLGLLGRGGSAEVCRARREPGGEIVALKVPVRRDAVAAARFRREAALLRAAAGHPSLPGLVDSGEDGGVPYIALEELEPGPLPSSSGAVEKFLLSLCEALGRLHGLGFVHRDVKPGNVLFRKDGSPVLVDLGFAKEADAPDSPLPAGEPLSLDGSRAMGLGTPGWSAPEQFAGGVLSPAADVYALGMLAMQCFDGRPPLSWRRVLRRATAPVPSGRYRDAAAFARAIRSRHLPFWLSFAAFAVLAAAIGAAFSLRASALSRRANESERRADETLGVVRAMLSAARPGNDAGRSGATVLEAAGRALPAVRAERDATLRARLASEFAGTLASVGRLAEAESLREIAVEALRESGENGEPLAEALERRGVARRRLGRLDSALADLDEALAIRRAAAARKPTAAARAALAGSLDSLGAALSFAGRGDEAAVRFGESVAVWRSLADENPGSNAVELARALHNLGVQLHELERYDEAVSAHEEALALFHARAAPPPATPALDRKPANTLPSPPHSAKTPVTIVLAPALSDAFPSVAHSGQPSAHGTPESNRELANQAPSVAHSGQPSTPGPLESNRDLANQAPAVAHSGQPSTSGILESNHELANQSPAVPHPGLTPAPGAVEDEARAMASLADSLRGAGRTDEAVAVFAEAIPRLRAMADSEPATWGPSLARTIGNHALLLDAIGDRAGAAAGLSEALAVLRERERAEPGSCAADIAAFEHDLRLVLPAAD